MKSRWLILLILLMSISMHLALPQAKLIPPNMQAIDDVVLANINMNRMCHIAADFGYDAAEKNLSREEMHKELKETLK